MIQKRLPAVVVGTSGKLKPLLDITDRDVNNGTTKENWYIGKALGKENEQTSFGRVSGALVMGTSAGRHVPRIGI